MHLETLRDKVLRDDLASFICRAFSATNPGIKYQHNWHIEVLAEHLEACARGEITRLLINMPPRMLKSICCSVAFPAWLLGNQPDARLICASYAHHLSLKHAGDFRELMKQPWYRHVFPEFRLQHGGNTKQKTITSKHGFRLAASVGGSITGEGADVIVVDDPQHASEVDSPTKRQNVIDWFEQSLTTRLNDKQNGAIIVVQQRLHPEDLSGHLLAKGGWEHLCFPAISPARDAYRRQGEALHKKRENLETLRKIKEELGSYIFESQYQQAPRMRAGNVFQPEWLKRYENTPTGTVVQSWDTAIKTGKQHDYTVCATFMEVDGVHHLTHLLRGKFDYPTLKRLIETHAENHKADIILLEDKASGQSLLQDLKRETTLPLRPIVPTKDKLSRAVASTAMFESGKVAFPTHAPWLAELETELFQFPHSGHDDQVDALTQYLNWVKSHKPSTPGMRRV